MVDAYLKSLLESPIKPASETVEGLAEAAKRAKAIEAAGGHRGAMGQ